METKGSGQLGERFVFVSPIVERWLGSFEDVERELRHVEFGDASTAYREASIVHLAVHDLVGITDDGEVGVVSNDDRLSASCGFMNCWYELGRDGLVVEVHLRLIQQQRSSSPVHDKVEQREHETTEQ